MSGIRAEIESQLSSTETLDSGLVILTDAEAREVAKLLAAYERINTPEVDEFLSAVRNEALHQRERWGVEQDGGKEPADWFWLVGYLVGKALHDVKGKRVHHIITAAAALLNWFSRETGNYAAPSEPLRDRMGFLTRTESDLVAGGVR